MVISWRRDKEQVLAEAGAVVGDQETGADPSKLLGIRRTNESELVKSGEKRVVSGQNLGLGRRINTHNVTCPLLSAKCTLH